MAVMRFSNIATYRLVWLLIRELSYEKLAEIRKKKPDVRASRGILGVILHSQSSTRRANID